MKEKILEIIEKSAEALYMRGLSDFDAKTQQYLISNCALGKLSELYENEEVAFSAKEAFLDAWFRGKITDNSHLSLTYGESRNVNLTAKNYLIFIFYGIGMPEGDTKMKKFADHLKYILSKRNPENKADIYHIAAYDDTTDSSRINDGLLADAVQVVLRAYMPYSSAVNRFCNMVEKNCKKNPDAELILIGYSGGGVVVSEMDEVLKQKNACLPAKIIRIGSPELRTPKDSLQKTVNIIIPGDPVPLVTFMRDKDRFNMNNRFLLDIKYDTVNPIKVHGLYFTDLADENGVKNYEKTAQAVAEYIK